MARVEVHGAALDLGAAEVAHFHRLIDGEERAHAARFRFERDRRRFIVRRGWMRSVLAGEIGMAPQALRFVEGPFGKPELAGGPCFSLSHSADRAVLAIASTAIGCDIEWIDPEIDWQPVADRLFGPAETAALAVLPEEHGRLGFFACWARKEAFVKALGQGLSYPLDAFEVSVDPAARLLAGGDGWAITALPIAPCFAGAIVARDDGVPLQIVQVGQVRLAA